MSKFKTLGFYAGFIGIFLILVLLILSQGEQLEKSESAAKNNSAQTEQVEHAPSGHSSDSFLSGLLNNLKHPISIALLQIIVIAAFSRIIGRLFLKIGQPIVIGEIFAGIFLGPSLLGYLLPDVSAFLFPVSSLGNLQFLSQIGLILFMFIIGMELDRSLLKNKAHQAVLLSHASIIFPYFLGVSAAYFIYDNYAPNTTTFTSFALFLGISMSITAFPVLARIVQEKGMTKSHLGIMALTCAAADDITAWSLLAVVIAIVKAGSIFGALVTVALSFLYLVFMLKVVQPLLNRVSHVYSSYENLNKTIVAFIFIYLLASAFITEAIG
ncbi:MAG TPA: cation:proton antiporter, partial [Ignavibacteriales bacterium]|nr:cation:proton antiporter [Ignavibacteriales bacterium]